MFDGEVMADQIVRSVRVHVENKLKPLRRRLDDLEAENTFLKAEIVTLWQELVKQRGSRDGDHC